VGGALKVFISNSQLNIVSPENFTVDHILIQNLLGQTIFSKKSLELPCSIPITKDLIPGIYLVSMIQNDQRVVKKIRIP
jgi:hypothetical protein